MKLIIIFIYLLLFNACIPMITASGSGVVLKDSVTGENLDDVCSSANEDDNRTIFPALQGKCDHVPEPSPHHVVTRLVINGEVCCVVQAYIDHGNGQITPFED
ncbi:MAG: hypothetical protein OXK80_03645 [Bdellovibrionales bacterium]|nr:hypothetical protein [Bdellovibrionales bacterium]